MIARMNRTSRLQTANDQYFARKAANRKES